jgi:Protein of unknown function (DUF493)
MIVTAKEHGTKYLRVFFRVWVMSSHQLYAAYAAMDATPGVKFKF